MHKCMKLVLKICKLCLNINIKRNKDIKPLLVKLVKKCDQPSRHALLSEGSGLLFIPNPRYLQQIAIKSFAIAFRGLGSGSVACLFARGEVYLNSDAHISPAHICVSTPQQGLYSTDPGSVRSAVLTQGKHSRTHSLSNVLPGLTMFVSRKDHIG